MFNQNSFSIDSGNFPNNSFNFNSPQKEKLNKSDAVKSNDEQYDFNANLANYNFRNVNPMKSSNNRQQQDNIKFTFAKQKENNLKKQQKKQSEKHIPTTYIDKLPEKSNSLLQDFSKPRGLLKQKIKVDYAFDHRNGQSQIVLPSKPMQKFPIYSQINTDFVSANLFSCMDAPEYERDFQISPKVISRRNF